MHISELVMVRFCTHSRIGKNKNGCYEIWTFFSELEVDQFIADGKLLFSRFDVEKVLQNGSSLLGSEGGQFNEDEKLAGNL